MVKILFLMKENHTPASSNSSRFTERIKKHVAKTKHGCGLWWGHEEPSVTDAASDSGIS